jgi:lactate racemase
MMREVDIVFGDKLIPVQLPEPVLTSATEYGTQKVDAIGDIRQALKDAMADPLGTPPIKETARPGMKVTIAFDDPTVPQIESQVWKQAIGLSLEELYAAGVKKKDINLVCANALHRKFTPRELGQLIGDDLVMEFKDQLHCHDAEDKANIVSLGRTASGYEVALSRWVTDADLVIYVNTMLQRAFNGGWKSICVGLSTYRSIRQHHHPDIMSMSTAQNPMHDILDEMGALVEEKLGRDRFFKFETLQKNFFQVSKFWAGSIPATRKAALSEMRNRFIRRRDMLTEKADIVLYGVPEGSPYAAFSRTNPFLSIISNGLGYLGGVIEGMGKPGGTVILATPAKEDWDLPKFEPYKKLFDEVLPHCRDPYEILEKYADEYANHTEFIHNYRFRYSHHPALPIFAAFPLRRLNYAGRVFIAGAENPEMIKRLGMQPFPSVEKAVAAAREIHGKDAAVAFTKYPVLPNRFFL